MSPTDSPAEIPPSSDLVGRIEYYGAHPELMDDLPISGTLEPGFFKRNGPELRALGASMLTLTGALMAVNLRGHDVQNPSLHDAQAPTPTPIRAENPTYFANAPKIVVSTPPPISALQAITDRLAAATAEVEDTQADQAPISNLPTQTNDLDNLNPPTPTVALTRTPTSEPATATATQPAASPTAEPTTKATNTIPPVRPTSTRRTREPIATATENPYDVALKDFLEETGIKFQLIKDAGLPPEFLEPYETSPSQADENLKKIFAITVMDMPPEIRQFVSERMKTIIIGRIRPDVSIADPENITSYMAESYTPGHIQTYFLDVVGGRTYDPHATTPVLPSGLTQEQDVKFAIVKGIWNDYFPSSGNMLDTFWNDNPHIQPSKWINFDDPKAVQFLQLLYLDPENRTLEPREMVIAIKAMEAAGLNTRLQEAINLGLFNFDQFPFEIGRGG